MCEKAFAGTVVYLIIIWVIDLKDGKVRLIESGGQINFILIE